MNNLTWMYENDEYVNSFAKLMAQVGGHATDSFTANEWLMAERNDDSAPEKVVSGSEQFLTAAGNWAKADAESRNTTKQPISQFDVSKSEETTENSTAKDEIRDFDDSREKLEADIMRKSTVTLRGDDVYLRAPAKSVWGWLDRQAAITRDEVNHDAGIAAHEAGKILREQIEELKAKVDDLTAERDYFKEQADGLFDQRERWCGVADSVYKRFHPQHDLYAFDNPAIIADILDADIGKLIEERDTTDRLNAEAHAMNDNLARENTRLEGLLGKLAAERDELKAKVDDLMDEPDYREAWERMRKERDEWRAKVEKAREEAEGFRERLSKALGLADEIGRLR